jgi:hypothetical protein
VRSSYGSPEPGRGVWAEPGSGEMTAMRWRDLVTVELQHVVIGPCSAAAALARSDQATGLPVRVTVVARTPENTRRA